MVHTNDGGSLEVREISSLEYKRSKDGWFWREGRRERGATEGKIQGWTFGPTDLGSNASHTTS